MSIAAWSDLFWACIKLITIVLSFRRAYSVLPNLTSNILTPDPYALSTAYANRLLQGQEVNQRENAERARKESG